MSSFVAAARRLATETGSSAFTVQQVVAASGQSLKSFYRYFEGKDDLLLALLEEDCAVGALFLGEMVGRRRTPQTRARAWVLGIFELMAAGEHGYVSVLVREHRRLAEERPAELELALRPFIELLAGDLADGMAAGQVRAGDPWRDARMILHLVLGAIHDLVLGIGRRRQAPSGRRRCGRRTRGPVEAGGRGGRMCGRSAGAASPDRRRDERAVDDRVGGRPRGRAGRPVRRPHAGTPG
ncbi:MAG: TetR family transcriptional regulator [Acidimicrobiales bacterium]